MNDEIIAIKLVFDFGKTYNRVMERKSDQGIDSIKIYINTDENDDLAYGFEDVVRSPINVILKEDNNISKQTEEKYMNLLNLYRNGKEIVLILNGEVHENSDNIKIDLNDELGDMKEISSSEFEKKYNKKADKDKLYYELNTIKKSKVIEDTFPSIYTTLSATLAPASKNSCVCFSNNSLAPSQSLESKTKSLHSDRFILNLFFSSLIDSRGEAPKTFKSVIKSEVL
jgi:hypothetical protein